MIALFESPSPQSPPIKGGEIRDRSERHVQEQTNITKSMGLGPLFVRCRGNPLHHGDDSFGGPL